MCFPPSVFLFNVKHHKEASSFLDLNVPPFHGAAAAGCVLFDSPEGAASESIRDERAAEGVRWEPSVGHTGPVFEFLIKSCSRDHRWITASKTSAVTSPWIIYLLIPLNVCIRLFCSPESVCERVCVCSWKLKCSMSNNNKMIRWFVEFLRGSDEVGWSTHTEQLSSAVFQQRAAVSLTSWLPLKRSSYSDSNTFSKCQISLVWFR